MDFHKFKHNFTLHLFCPISACFEEMKHLLLCHVYDENRRNLLNSVNDILRLHESTGLSSENLHQIILYDHENTALDSNSNFVEAKSKQICRFPPWRNLLSFFLHSFFVIFCCQH